MKLNSHQNLNHWSCRQHSIRAVGTSCARAVWSGRNRERRADACTWSGSDRPWTASHSLSCTSASYWPSNPAVQQVSSFQIYCNTQAHFWPHQHPGQAIDSPPPDHQTKDHRKYVHLQVCRPSAHSKISRQCLLYLSRRK